MEFAKLKNLHVCWNRRNKFPMSNLYGVYAVNRYPLCVILPGICFFKVSIYWSHVNTPLSDHMKYNTQCSYYPTIQFFV